MTFYDALLVFGLVGTIGLAMYRDRALRAREQPVTRGVVASLAIVAVILALAVRLTGAPYWLTYPAAFALVVLCVAPMPMVRTGRAFDQWLRRASDINRR